MIARILLVLLLLLGAGPALAQESLSDLVRTFAQARSQGEIDARDLKAYVPEDRDGARLYEQSRGLYNSLIRQLTTDLAQRHDPRITADFKAQLRRAVEAGERLTAHTNAVRQRLGEAGAKGPGVMFIPPVLEAVSKMLDSIGGLWDLYQRTEGKRRKDIRDMLEGEMWLEWGRL